MKWRMALAISAGLLLVLYFIIPASADRQKIMLYKGDVIVLECANRKHRAIDETCLVYNERLKSCIKAEYLCVLMADP